LRILIIQTAFLGDVILATPLIEGLKHLHPESRICFLTIPYSAPILKNHPGLEEIYIYDKRAGWKENLRVLKWLKSRRFDQAIVPHRSLRSALLVFSAGIKQRIGFDRSAGKFLFTKTLQYRREWHEVKRNLYLIGLENNDIPPRIFTGDEEYTKADTFLKEKSVNNAFICIAPGSIWNTKKWPQEYYHDLCNILKNKGYPPVVLIGGKSERDICERVAGGMKDYAFIAAGRLNPLESAALIQKSKLMICNDSAAGHIAAAVGTKVISIFGPTDPVFGFAPYGENNIVIEHSDLYCRPCRIHGSKKCPQGHFKCMKEIIPETVFDKIKVSINHL